MISLNCFVRQVKDELDTVLAAETISALSGRRPSLAPQSAEPGIAGASVHPSTAGRQHGVLSRAAVQQRAIHSLGLLPGAASATAGSDRAPGPARGANRRAGVRWLRTLAWPSALAHRWQRRVDAGYTQAARTFRSVQHAAGGLRVRGGVAGRAHACGDGMLLEMCIGPLVQHEMSTAPQMHERLRADDVLIADRGFSSYVHLALLVQQGLHRVFRVHQRKKVSFKRGRARAKELPARRRNWNPNPRLIRAIGPNEQVVRDFKCNAPTPKWMQQATYEALPETIEVRELRYWIKRKGFRAREVILVTTLTDEQTYPANELIDLYGDRWQVEVTCAA